LEHVAAGYEAKALLAEEEKARQDAEKVSQNADGDAEAAVRRQRRIGNQSALWLTLTILFSVLALGCGGYSFLVAIVGFTTPSSTRSGRTGEARQANDPAAAMSGLLYGFVCTSVFAVPAIVCAIALKNEGAAFKARLAAAAEYARSAAQHAASVKAKANQAALEASDRASKAMQHLKALIQAACSAPLQAVVYLGWEGTVHSFGFWNHEYAAAFVQANDPKVI
jgi:hypothetical protein